MLEFEIIYFLSYQFVVQSLCYNSIHITNFNNNTYSSEIMKKRNFCISSADSTSRTLVSYR